MFFTKFSKGCGIKGVGILIYYTGWVVTFCIILIKITFYLEMGVFPLS